MNLLNETLGVLNENNLKPEDVLWVGNLEVKTDWENFVKIANIEYDSGFGGQEVADDLIIVGKTWWLERHEHNGSEWWEFKQLPKEPDKKVTLKLVVGGRFWVGLKEHGAY